MTLQKSPQNEINDFLRRFRRALATLPADIREDVVGEVGSHLQERSAQGKLSLEASFGTPEAYASQFLAEAALDTAVARGTPWSLFSVLMAEVRITALTIFVVLPLAAVEIMAVAVTLIGFLKPFGGNHIGLFLLSNGGFGAVGWVSDPASMHEVLGYTAMPIFICSGLLLFWIANKLMLNVVRRELAALRNGKQLL